MQLVISYLFQPCGQSGPNVLDHVVLQDEEFARSNLVARDLNSRKKIAQMPMICVLNQSLILWQKVSFFSIKQK